jgi:hypothetical protein
MANSHREKTCNYIYHHTGAVGGVVVDICAIAPILIGTYFLWIMSQECRPTGQPKENTPNRVYFLLIVLIRGFEESYCAGSVSDHYIAQQGSAPKEQVLTRAAKKETHLGLFCILWSVGKSLVSLCCAFFYCFFRILFRHHGTDNCAALFMLSFGHKATCFCLMNLWC